MRRLRAERPGDAVLSEEAYDDLKRIHADRVWIIDPWTAPGSTRCRAARIGRCVALWQRTGAAGRRHPNSAGAHDGAITDAAVALPAMGRCTAATP